jgi:tRNA (mo5U34)-methyltransferase
MSETLIDQIAKLPWFHSIDFGNGCVSPGKGLLADLQAQAAAYFSIADPRGRSVLDIGCWDGFNSIEAYRRGASRVLGTDHFTWSDAGWGDRRAFDLARARLAPEIEAMDIDVAELTLEKVGRWGIVLFLGVFYHLRHPFHVLERIAPLVGSTLIVETYLDAMDIERPAMIFYPEAECAGDPTNWWGPNVACVTAMLYDLGFGTVRHTVNPVHANRGIFHAIR